MAYNKSWLDFGQNCLVGGVGGTWGGSRIMKMFNNRPCCCM